MIKDIIMHFKEIFTDLLFEKNEGNQTELSRQTGIPVPTINGWLTKGKLPRAEHLVTLANHFSVSIDYLLGLENYKFEYIKTKTPALNDENAKKTKLLKDIIKKVAKMSQPELKVISSVISLLEEKAKTINNDE